MTTHVPIPKPTNEEVTRLLTTNKVAAWLADKDHNTEYTYQSSTDCLLARYMKAHGFHEIRCGGSYVRIGNTADCPTFEIPSDLCWCLHANTYGEVLRRCITKIIN